MLRLHSLMLLVLGSSGVLLSSQTWAGGKARNSDSSEERGSELQDRSRKGVLLRDFPQALIELPGGGEFELGADLQATLAGKLTESGKYWVVEEAGAQKAPSLLPLIAKDTGAGSKANDPDWVWNGSRPEAFSTVLRVESFLLQTGERGERAAYGFDSRNPRVPNDFPLKTNEDSKKSGASYFGNAFNPVSESEWRTYAGLDLGQGLSLDVFFAFLKLKLSRFILKTHATLEFQDAATFEKSTHPMLIQTTGFYFDLTGGYAGFSGGIAVAREDVLRRAAKSLGQLILPQVESYALKTRHRGVLDAILPATNDREQILLLGTGLGSQIRERTAFISRSREHRLEVIRSVESGCVAKLVQGSVETLFVGEEFIEEPSESDTAKTSLLRSALSRVHVPQNGNAPLETLEQDLGTLQAPIRLSSEYWSDTAWGRALLDFLSGNILLPYRIYRFGMTDQKVHREPDWVDEEDSHFSLGSWRETVARSRSARTLGFSAGKNRFQESPDEDQKSERPLIALIDSGVDYNQPILHTRLHRRADAVLDEFSRGNRFGWDFASGDSQPYDDHGRGTAVASILAAGAPRAKILALKTFNPWGVTTTASLVNAIRMSREAGAQIIVLGWSTSRESSALKQAIQEATRAGVLVVTSSGDTGMNLSLSPEYPAAWSKEIPGLLSVAALNGRGDWLYQEGRKGSSYSSQLIQIGVPAEDLPVLKPRARMALASGSALATAWVAAAAARLPIEWTGVQKQSWILDHARISVGALDRVIDRGRILQWEP